MCGYVHSTMGIVYRIFVGICVFVCGHVHSCVGMCIGLWVFVFFVCGDL